MKVLTMLQGSGEWHAARRCRLRSSDLHKLITSVKAELSTQADAFIDELIGEAAFLGPNRRPDAGCVTTWIATFNRSA